MARISYGWIGVDFDGTLATYAGNHAILGEPIPLMVNRVKFWLARGYAVKIFTARVSIKDETIRADIVTAMEQWCVTHIGKKLEVTCVKDIYMTALYDDKAVQVVKNTGYLVTKKGILTK